MKDYDIIIIGGGMAGLTAAIYASRSRLNTLVLEKATCGGLANWAVKIENFPSHQGIGGMELMERVKAQAIQLGAEIKEIVEISRVELHERPKIVETDEGVFRAPSLIIAMGREPIRLLMDVESEHIHYCAICDGAGYRGQHVLVVGGGNSGVQDALYLLDQGVWRVTLIEQAERLLAAQTAQDALFCRPNAEVLLCTEVQGLEMDERQMYVTLRHLITGDLRQVVVKGVFVYMGQAPQSEMFRGLLAMDEQGYIIGDEEMRTNVEGVFVAGDVRRKKYRQLTTAMSDGMIAALEAEEYLRSLERLDGQRIDTRRNEDCGEGIAKNVDSRDITRTED